MSQKTPVIKITQFDDEPQEINTKKSDIHVYAIRMHIIIGVATLLCDVVALLICILPAGGERYFLSGLAHASQGIISGVVFILTGLYGYWEQRVYEGKNGGKQAWELEFCLRKYSAFFCVFFTLINAVVAALLCIVSIIWAVLLSQISVLSASMIEEYAENGVSIVNGLYETVVFCQIALIFVGLAECMISLGDVYFFVIENNEGIDEAEQATPNS